MAGHKRLSQKQKDFARNFIETKGNATEAAMRSYTVKNRNTAGVMGRHQLTRPDVLKEIERLMDEGEITDELLMSRLREGLSATLTTSFEGETNQTDIPDHYARFKFLDASLKLRDYYPSQKTENKNINLTIDAQLENMSKEEFAEILQNLLKQTKQKDGKSTSSISDTS